MSKIAYDLRLIKGVAFDVDGVLSPSTMPMSPDGMPLRMVNVKDGYALRLAVKSGLKIAIISGAHEEGLRVRFNALGVNDVYLKSAGKLPVLTEWMAHYGLKPEETAFVGDDIPDWLPMKHCGLSVCPADAAEDIRAIATYISPVNGGAGVGRDLLEEILRAQGAWMTGSHAFEW